MFIQAAAMLHTGANGGSVSRHASRRTHEPIRRQSRLKGREGVFWRPVTRSELDKIMLAAVKYDTAMKQPGKRTGPLGLVALQVLALLANKVNRRTGQLDPSIEFLMAKLRRSRDAIVRALKALREHGFLDWLRRYVPTGNEGPGPKVQQTSNAYRLSLPARALRLLGRFGVPSPLPDDFTHAREQRSAQIDVHLADFHPVDRAVYAVEDEGLRAVLASLGHLLFSRKERESVEQTESPSSFYSKRK